MSNYIYGFDPNKYGGNQEDFLKQSNIVIDQAVQNFHLSVKDDSNLTQLFHDTLAFFENARHKIALEHNTKDANRFGERRDRVGTRSDDKFFHLSFATPLYKPYHEYNSRVIKVMQEHLKNMKHTKKEFLKTELEVIGKPCLNRKFSMDFSILRKEEEMKELEALVNPTYEIYTKLCKLCSIEPEKKSSHITISELMLELLQNQQAMAILKKKAPQEYKKNKLLGPIRVTYGLLPDNRKSDWVVATLRLEINGKMYALSQYLTWMYRDCVKDPVERMSHHSLAVIVHQDPFLIDTMLEEISKIFQKAIEWNGKDLNELMNDVALLEYLFAHSMPHHRGSGAIAEWLERAIFRYHNYNVEYNKNKMVTFEAYTSSLDKFVKNYKTKLIHLEKMATAETTG